MKSVKIAWNRYAAIPAAMPFADALTASDFAQAVEEVLASAHPAFELTPGVVLEIPPPEWAHGEFLVYLPDRNWMVRRKYVEHWYIDIGITKRFQDSAWGWTDLWLDVTAPEPANQYHLLDADEFAEALRCGSMSVSNAALAMDSLNALVTTIHDGAFPVPEVRLAEAFYSSYRRTGILPE